MMCPAELLQCTHLITITKDKVFPFHHSATFMNTTSYVDSLAYEITFL